jgi:polygalacturonase
MLIRVILFLSYLLFSNSYNIYINDFGALVDGESTTDAALQNGLAFNKAVKSSCINDTIILLENETIYYIPNTDDNSEPFFENINNIVFNIDGNIILHDNISAWPLTPKNTYYHMLDIRYSSNITITGQGTIYGNGYEWWKEFALGNIVRQRPSLIEFNTSQNIIIQNITLLDSPRFNIYCYNVLNLEVRYMKIWVDIKKQNLIYKNYVSDLHDRITFPFNTDGVDFSGKNIYIHDMNISNYDDVIAVKPSKNNVEPINNQIISCTENVLVDNINVYGGVGLSVGSVSPIHNSCIKNVIFQNIYAIDPIKFIYIKTQSHKNVTQIQGYIKNITYQNMTALNPILWPIYLGPQQQKEPDGTGDGIWPNTNPYINISDIYFKNINVKNSKINPGVLRCNSSNPCYNVQFQNVTVNNNENKKLNKYICDDGVTVTGSYDLFTYPIPNNCIH